MICRVCGEDKEPTQFYKIKYFYKYLSSKRVWCRECQKLYVDMKKKEVEKKKFDDKVEQGTFCVSFS